MSSKYRYDHRSQKHKKRHVFIVLVVSALVVAVFTIVILVLINQTTKKIKTVSGPTEQVGVVTGNPSTSTKTVDELNYSFQLPVGWHQIKNVSLSTVNYITWESFVPHATNRYFSIYSDPIPPTFAVNKELPVEAHGSTLSFGSLSDNCANFTNTGGPKSNVPIVAKWQDVTFYCNSPNFADNQIGTGTTGAINSVQLVGQMTGTKHYFFLYIDRNSSPDYSILYSMLDSFQAK